MTPQELKNSILQLAIQGKLVDQRPEEGTGKELLEKILRDRAAETTKQTRTTGKAKVKSRVASRASSVSSVSSVPVVPPIPDDEKPFDIPESWEWVRLGECSTYADKKEKVLPSEIRPDDWSLDLEDIEKDTGRIVEFRSAGDRRITGDKVVFRQGQILYSKLRPYLKKILVAPKDGICTPELVPFSTLGGIEVNYLVIVLKSPHVDFAINSVTYGVKMPRVGTDTMVNLPIPLPPLAEQKRIVAKIEELLPYIDRYEKAWSKLEDFNKRFPGDMQKSLLQMAIQGKLVDQRLEEGTGEELAHALRLKKNELIQSGQIAKKPKTKPFYTQEELCEYGIPDTWCWVQLSDVSVIQEGAGIRKWQYRDNGTQILCVTNILEGAIDLERKKLFISTEEYLEKYRHLTPQKGDIVSACSGGSWGKTAIFDCSDTTMLNTSTLRLRFFGDLASNGYLYYLTKSAFFKKQLERQLAGMQPNFGYAHYSRIMFPLPPLAEQKRIVAKLEELLPLCERLK